jgi:prepilin-type N-terminal cleavage/methylation domain-containing protein
MGAPGDSGRVRRARAGFSMIEMLGVLLILGMIATIVTVNWRAILPRTELHAAVRGIADKVQSTRSEAISRNAVYRVEYDLDKHRYRVNTPFRLALDGMRGGLAQRDEDRVSLPWVYLPDSVRFLRVQIDGVDYTQGLVFVRFDPLGSASGHAIVLVQQPGDQFYTIEVQGLTGLVDYREGQVFRDVAEEGDFQ